MPRETITSIEIKAAFQARSSGGGGGGWALLLFHSGVPDFEAAYAYRVMRTIAECEVPFIGRAELIDNKRATGRLRDQADVEALGEEV